MASELNDFEQHFDNQITCGICLARYENPKVLPCLHSFCCKCVEQLAVKGLEVLCLFVVVLSDLLVYGSA